MNRFNLIYVLVLLLVTKVVLVYFSNSLGDNLLNDLKKYEEKKLEIQGFKAVKDSIFGMHKPLAMDTIRTVDNLNVFVKTQDDNIEKGINELKLMIADKDRRLKKFKMVDIANVINNGLIVCLTLFMVIRQVNKQSN